METDSYVYDAFGAVTSSTGTTSNGWLFTGEQRDGDTELYFLRARYYDPEIGRFLARDPIEFAQRYAYAGNNPVAYTDPSGLEEIGEGFSCWYRAYPPQWPPHTKAEHYNDHEGLEKIQRPRRPCELPRKAAPAPVDEVPSSPGGYGGQVPEGCAQGFAQSRGEWCPSPEDLRRNPPQQTHASPAIGPLGEWLGQAGSDLAQIATSRTSSCYASLSVAGAGGATFLASFFVGGVTAPQGAALVELGLGFAAEECGTAR